MRRLYIGKLMAGAVFFWVAFAAMTATGTTVSAETFGGFSIRAVIPDNQIDKRQTYFDLRMKPGDEQDIQVVVTNSRSEDITAEVTLNDASSGRNGLIVYTRPDSRDESLKLAITDVAAPLTQMITVPAQGSKTATIHIRMPEEAFDGVILGGIAVTGKDDGSGANDENEQANGVTVKNTVTYVTALKLTENDGEVQPDFELVSVAPELVNYKTAVVANLRNKAARIVKGMEIRAAVHNKGSDVPIRELSLDKAEMAPLSKAPFVIDWGGQELKPGAYRLKMTAGYADHLWEWDEEFVISGEAKALNKNAVGIQKNYVWLYLSAGVAALVLVFVLAYLLGRRKSRHEAQ